MSEKTIRVARDMELKYFPLDKLQEFQGNLKKLSKDNYERLRNLIIDNDFSFPISVWINDAGEHKIIDGHQRVRVLTQMKKEGWQIPEIPSIIVSASTEEVAAEKLLAATSQFGVIDTQGLYEFISKMELDPVHIMADFKLPEIDMPKFFEEYYGEPEADDEEEEAAEDSDEEGQDKVSHIRQVQLFYNEEQHAEFMNLAGKAMKEAEISTLSDYILALLRGSAK